MFHGPVLKMIDFSSGSPEDKSTFCPNSQASGPEGVGKQKENVARDADCPFKKFRFVNCPFKEVRSVSRAANKIWFG